MTREKNPQILVVDDDRVSRQMMQDMLVPLGYEVILACDGQAALDAAREFRPHLIFMDVVMPVLDGFEACRRLKSDLSTQRIPVVLVTSLEGQDSKIQGLAAGASDFISKPVDGAELELRARNLLRVVDFEDFLRRHNEELDIQVRERTGQLHEALEEVRRSKEELKKSYLDTIFKLTTVAECKDGFTSSHIRRVGHYCRFLAREIGWDETQQEEIFHASPMHDIGKVGLPSEILLKPGPLSPEEYALAKTHTTAGARILQGSTSTFIRMAEIIALTHHERYDGSGYPRSLSGDDIPLAGLIMNLADQYEALRSERPYKPPLAHEATVRIMIHGDGRTIPAHFHPHLLEVFGDTAARFNEIFMEFSQNI